jgi:hypothetical protein
VEGPETPDRPDEHAHLVRFALGVAVLAGERIGRGAAPSDAVVMGVGLLQEAAEEVASLARRVLGAPVRAALRPLAQLSASSDSQASTAPAMLARAAGAARRHGEATVAAGREDVETFVSAMVTDGLVWAQSQALPQLIDSVLPVIERVMPRIIDAFLPVFRAQVLPALIEDLSRDPRIRQLVVEESKNAASGATTYLRVASANADDRVENAVRRLGHKNGSAHRHESA